jgi:hypothetical protein
MTVVPTLLSLTASGIYAFVVLMTISAAGVAFVRRQQPWHVRAWLLLAALFAGLMVMRFYGLEEALRDNLRFELVNDGLYEDRRSFQRPVAAVVVVLIALGAFAWIYNGFRTVHGRRNVSVLIACASAFTMIGLVAMRIVSLSPVDQVLYGPLKLNWIADVGTSIAVLASGAYYARLVNRAP